MNQLIKETLKDLTLCPKCGASWESLEEDLNEPLHSESYRQVLLIIFNCHVCTTRFRRELNNKEEK